MQTKQRSLTQSDERILSILSYVKGTTNRIDKILNKHNIRTIYKPPKKKEQILRIPKHQRPPLSSAGMHKISCSYGQIYIRETGRMINLQIKEHQRDIRLKHAISTIRTQHRNWTSNTV